jgi:hypothetical protein
MKIFFATVAAALFLSGCAAPVYKHDVQGLQRSEAINFVDARPKAESEQKIFSLMITSDAYATYRYSTSTLDPSAVRLFKHKIYEKFPDSAKPVDVKVYHFVSYMNLQASLKRTAIGSIFGGVGAAVAAGTQNYNADFKVVDVNREQFDAITEDNEYTKSFFSEAENPNKAPVFIVYIDADINGKRSFVRGISPTARSDGKNSYLYVVENTIAAFLSKY